MRTSETECLEALREAAEMLGESPTKAEYEELGLTPASATIIRVIGGWNDAKERAGLETEPSTGTRVGPKPEGLDLPEDTAWGDLTVDQRWHYRNVSHNAERTLERRARLRQWANERKQATGCSRCDETEPASLDFHHTEATRKEMAIGEMITHGYGKEKLRDEMEHCEVLCANCHRREHYDWPETETADRRARLRSWLYEQKRASGCTRCGETDPRCLVCHHDGEKEATIAELVSSGRPKTEIADELERCVVLCANCHRKEHVEPPRPGE